MPPSLVFSSGMTKIVREGPATIFINLYIHEILVYLMYILLELLQLKPSLMINLVNSTFSLIMNLLQHVQGKILLFVIII